MAIDLNNIDEMKQIADTAIKSMYQMIMVVNGHTLECQVLDYNQELRSISEEIDLFDKFCEDLCRNIHPEDREEFKLLLGPTGFAKELKEKVFTSYACRVRHVNSQYYWSNIIFCNATKEDSTEGNDYLFLIQDIHDWKMKELQEDAKQRAMVKQLQEKYADLFEENMKDEQTGCYNRKGMKYYTDILLDETRKNGNHIFVCVADLNGLKHLNDTYGHAAGDEAIAAVSSELLKAAPKGTRIVRTGGDEFLLMASLPADSKEPEEMSVKIDEGLKEYNLAHPNPFTIGASYGWVLLPIKDGMIDLDEYIEIADKKMYDMKVQRDEYRRD